MQVVRCNKTSYKCSDLRQELPLVKPILSCSSLSRSSGCCTSAASTRNGQCLALCHYASDTKVSNLFTVKLFELISCPRLSYTHSSSTAPHQVQAAMPLASVAVAHPHVAQRHGWHGAAQWPCSAGNIHQGEL